MLIKYSYRNKKQTQEVNELVGKAYTLWARIKMNGNGSQRFRLVNGNAEITNIINTKSTTHPYLNIELRPHGLILHIRVRLDNWALVLPYHTLSLFGQDNQLKLYSNKWKITLEPFGNAPLRRDFISKALLLKADNMLET